MTKYAWVLLVLLAFGFISSPAQAYTQKSFSGEVIKVIDGDSFIVLTPEHRSVEVRLAGVDAPEYKQKFGKNSRYFLSRLIFKENVTVKKQTTDKYGRTIGFVYLNGLNIDDMIVENGMAWVYRQYNNDPKLIALEEQAKTAKKGLWSLPADEIIPPWEWRHCDHKKCREKKQ